MTPEQTFARIDWTCPICDEVLRLTVQLVEGEINGDEIAVTAETVPASTDAVYEHAERHGIKTGQEADRA